MSEIRNYRDFALDIKKFIDADFIHIQSSSNISFNEFDIVNPISSMTDVDLCIKSKDNNSHCIIIDLPEIHSISIVKSSCSIYFDSKGVIAIDKKYDKKTSRKISKIKAELLKIVEVEKTHV